MLMHWVNSNTQRVERELVICLTVDTMPSMKSDIDNILKTNALLIYMELRVLKKNIRLFFYPIFDLHMVT